MALQAYLKIQGSKQGKFKGDAARSGHLYDWIQVVSFSYGVQSPRDVATGQASGKRQHKSFVFHMDAAATVPQLYRALTTNEILTDVTIEFVDTNKDGKEYLRHKMTLANAAISRVRPQAIVTKGSIRQGYDVALEGFTEVELTFHPIEVNFMNGGKSASDDWQPRP